MNHPYFFFLNAKILQSRTDTIGDCDNGSGLSVKLGKLLPVYTRISLVSMLSMDDVRNSFCDGREATPDMFAITVSDEDVGLELSDQLSKLGDGAGFGSWDDLRPLHPSGIQRIREALIKRNTSLSPEDGEGLNFMTRSMPYGQIGNDPGHPFAASTAEVHDPKTPQKSLPARLGFT